MANSSIPRRAKTLETEMLIPKVVVTSSSGPAPPCWESVVHTWTWQSADIKISIINIYIYQYNSVLITYSYSNSQLVTKVTAICGAKPLSSHTGLGTVGTTSLHLGRCSESKNTGAYYGITMVYFDEFPKSILFVLAVSLVHASEFIPAFNLHSFQRHVDSVPCSQPRAQLLKKAHKKKDPRAMQLSSHCSLRKAGTQTNASSTTLIAQKQIYMYTCIYTQKNHQHVDLSTHIITGICVVWLSMFPTSSLMICDGSQWFICLRYSQILWILLTPRLAWSITKRPAWSFTTQKILTNFAVLNKFTSSTLGETSASASSLEFAWPTTLAGA